MIRSGNNVVKLFSSILALSMPLVLQAADDLAKQAQNSIANLISLPLQNNTNFNVGRDERIQNILNVQPVWPVTLNENRNLITRTIVPVMSQPLASGDRENGLGDTTFTGFFSPIDSGDFTWGVGPVVLIPTSTDDALGVGEWGLGASVVGLTQPGNWVIGSLLSNVWSKKENGTLAVNLFTCPVLYQLQHSGRWWLTFFIGSHHYSKLGS